MSTKIIGLTGGIGSGKTTIANYFLSLGIPVYIADEEAKKLLYDQGVVNAVKEALGEEVLTNGLPDKKKLAEIVFNDKQKLALLNSIIHPKVQEHFYEWVQSHQNSNFVIKEAAILFESGSYKDCDKVILVTAPLDVRVKRVMARDNVTEDKVLERIANQWDDERKAKLSDYVITNISLEAAKKEVDKIVKELVKIQNL